MYSFSRRNYSADDEYSSVMDDKSDPATNMSQSAFSRRSSSRDFGTNELDSGDTSLLAQRLAAGKRGTVSSLPGETRIGRTYLSGTSGIAPPSSTYSTPPSWDSDKLESQSYRSHLPPKSTSSWESEKGDSQLYRGALPAKTVTSWETEKEECQPYRSHKSVTAVPSWDTEMGSSSKQSLSPYASWDSEKGDGLSGIRAPSPGGFNMATGQGGKLVQEIHDEFLVCKICLEGYKSPKSLNCLHTFCENCIENHVMSESTYKKYSDYREFTCPLCRKRTQLPIGGVKKLPDNFLVSSLSEMVIRQKPSKFPFCDICKLVSRKHKEAASKCLDCAKLLCKQCVEMHKDTKVTANHNIFDVEIEKDIECKEHQDEVVRFYCEPCETCICVLCTFNEHKDHEITQFAEAVSKYKDNIQTMLESCNTKIKKFDDQIDSLNCVEEIIKEAEQKVHDTAIQFIADIRNREKHLVEELRNLYGNELMDYIDNRKDLSATVDGLRSTCNLTEVILKGKDIELLLLKKDVQKKLSSLGDIEIKTLPNSVNKKVTFLAGSIDLGVMQDSDRPMLSKMRNKKIVGSVDDTVTDGSEQTVLCQHQGTQTDLKRSDIKEKKEESETEDDTGDDDSDNESEEESEDEKETKKKETKDTGVQYERQGGETTEEETEESEEEEEEEEEEKPEMVDQSTATDEVPTEEKAVNTRSRSLQSLSHINRRSPPKENENDNSLAARRRRRRERAATTQLGTSYQDVPDTSDSYHDDIYNDHSHKGRGGSRFLSYNRSIDDDVYYDGTAY